MIDNPLDPRLRELCWRRKLTPAEEAQVRSALAAHPAARADLEIEASLTEALSRLPDAPMPSNFTARVLEAATRAAPAAAARGRKQWRFRFWPLAWAPRMAVAALALGAGLITYRQVQVHQRQARAESLRVVSEIAALPNPQVLEDFDAIFALGQTPPADEELLKLLE